MVNQKETCAKPPSPIIPTAPAQAECVVNVREANVTDASGTSSSKETDRQGISSTVQQHPGQRVMAKDTQMPRQLVGGHVNHVEPQTQSNMHNPSLQQLIEILKNPHTPEQQNKILQMLKSNPSLMSAFIKQRQQTGQ